MPVNWLNSNRLEQRPLAPIPKIYMVFGTLPILQNKFQVLWLASSIRRQNVHNGQNVLGEQSTTYILPFPFNILKL